MKLVKPICPAIALCEGAACGLANLEDDKVKT
jgi:hypothetical protein